MLVMNPVSEESISVFGSVSLHCELGFKSVKKKAPRFALPDNEIRAPFHFDVSSGTANLVRTVDSLPSSRTSSHRA